MKFDISLEYSIDPQKSSTVCVHVILGATVIAVAKSFLFGAECDCILLKARDGLLYAE